MEANQIIKELLEHMNKCASKPNFVMLRKYIKKLSEIDLNEVKDDVFIQAISKYIDIVINFSSNRESREQIKLCRQGLNILPEIITKEKITVFMKRITQKVFDILIEEDVNSWCVKRELLKMFLLCSVNTPKSVKKDTMTALPDIYLFKIVDLISTYGDYDFQVTLIEMVFRLYGKSVILSKIKEIIPESQELSESFVHINGDTFDDDARRFLNALNEASGKVFSVICGAVSIGNTKCGEPIEDIGGLWVDFNISENAVSWYCTQHSLKDDVENDAEDFWVLVMFFEHDVESVKVYRPPKSEDVILYVKLRKPCIVAREGGIMQNVLKADNVKLIVSLNSAKTSTLLYRILPNMFKHKFMLQNNQKVSLSRKTVYKPLKVTVLRKSVSESSKSKSDTSCCTAFLDPVSIKSGDTSVTSPKSGSVLKPRSPSSDAKSEVITISGTSVHSIDSSVELMNDNEAANTESQYNTAEVFPSERVEVAKFGSSQPNPNNVSVPLLGNSAEFSDGLFFDNGDSLNRIQIVSGRCSGSMQFRYSQSSTKTSTPKKRSSAVYRKEVKCSVGKKVKDDNAAQSSVDKLSQFVNLGHREQVAQQCVDKECSNLESNSENFETANENLENCSKEVASRSKIEEKCSASKYTPVNLETPTSLIESNNNKSLCGESAENFETANDQQHSSDKVSQSKFTSIATVEQSQNEAKETKNDQLHSSDKVAQSKSTRIEPVEQSQKEASEVRDLQDSSDKGSQLKSTHEETVDQSRKEISEVRDQQHSSDKVSQSKFTPVETVERSHKETCEMSIKAKVTTRRNVAGALPKPKGTMRNRKGTRRIVDESSELQNTPKKSERTPFDELKLEDVLENFKTPPSNMQDEEILAQLSQKEADKSKLMSDNEDLEANKENFEKITRLLEPDVVITLIDAEEFIPKDTAAMDAEDIVDLTIQSAEHAEEIEKAESVDISEVSDRGVLLPENKLLVIHIDKLDIKPTKLTIPTALSSKDTNSDDLVDIEEKSQSIQINTTQVETGLDSLESEILEFRAEGKLDFIEVIDQEKAIVETGKSPENDTCDNLKEKENVHYPEQNELEKSNRGNFETEDEVNYPEQNEVQEHNRDKFEKEHKVNYPEQNDIHPCDSDEENDLFENVDQQKTENNVKDDNTAQIKNIKATSKPNQVLESQNEIQVDGVSADEIDKIQDVPDQEVQPAEENLNVAEKNQLQGVGVVKYKEIVSEDVNKSVFNQTLSTTIGGTKKKRRLFDHNDLTYLEDVNTFKELTPKDLEAKAMEKTDTSPKPKRRSAKEKDISPRQEDSLTKAEDWPAKNRDPSPTVPVKKRVYRRKRSEGATHRTLNAKSRTIKKKHNEVKKRKIRKACNLDVSLDLNEDQNLSGLQATLYEMLQSFREEAGNSFPEIIKTNETKVLLMNELEKKDKRRSKTSLPESLRDDAFECPTTTEARKSKKINKKDVKIKLKPKRLSVKKRRSSRRLKELDTSSDSSSLELRKRSVTHHIPIVDSKTDSAAASLAVAKKINIISDIRIMPKRPMLEDDIQVLPKKQKPAVDGAGASDDVEAAADMPAVLQNISQREIQHWIETGSPNYSQIISERRIALKLCHYMFKGVIGNKDDSVEYRDAKDVYEISKKYK